MTTTAKHRWIDPLCSELGCSPSFADAMETQLATQALMEHAVALDGGFSLMPLEWVPKIDVTDDGISTVEVDLVGPDGQGDPAVIAWSDTTGDTPIAPSVPVDGYQHGRLRFWWHEFPVGELERLRLSAPLVETSVQVVWCPLTWPDVEIRFAVAGDASANWSDSVTAVVGAVVEQWNAQDEVGVIHGWTLPERLPSGDCVICVDFGSAPHAALGALLDALGALLDPPLRRITVCALGTPRD